jgi:hypothetical protein
MTATSAMSLRKRITIVTSKKLDYTDYTMRTLIINKDQAGQYTYQIVSGEREFVASQYGTFDLESTIEQARSRFSFDIIVNLTK